jgi:hypothetical protein
MFSKLFKRNDPSQLDSFLDSTTAETWDYLDALQLKPGQLHQATHEQLMDNPSDVAIGVNKVEVVSGRYFFELFGSLIIKHHDDGEVRLMFNNTISDSAKVLALYEQLKGHLGGGIHYEPKFASFHDPAKVAAVAGGKYDGHADGLLHFWQKGRFGFTLNYKIDPLRQLVFIVTFDPEKVPDTQVRESGTLIGLLKHDIHEVFIRQEISATPVSENGQVKFIDYTFRITPPELGLFELIQVRIFGTEKTMANVKSLLVTYQTRRKPESSAVIRLVDQLVKIYGMDGSGYAEMRPHEIDMVDEDPYWTGRSWLINQDHGLQDMDDPRQQTLYWINLTLNPEDGLNLSVLGFDDMQAYQQRL